MRFPKAGKSVAGVAMAVSSMLLGAAPAAAAGFCGAGSNVPRPQNVILFVLDDSSPSDLPFFNTPLVWPDQDNPPRTLPDPVLTEGALRLPEYNRAMARFYASRNCPSGLCSLGDNFLHPTSSSSLVVPVDLDGDQTVVSATNADSFRYVERNQAGNLCGEETGTCDANTDVLSSHGGLRKLVEEGLAFRRFYATSAKCAPTRASMFTGRYPGQVGVSLNGSKLEISELTAGDLLKGLPGCKDDDENTPCYSTGHLAKWHLGSKEHANQTPWQRGADEAVFFRGASRVPFKDSQLLCGPPPMPHNPPANYRQGFYCNNAALAAAVPGCITSSQCDAACPGGPGRCACAEGRDVVSSDDNFCYELDPTPCASDSECRAGASDHDTCVAWGQNVGPGNQTACHPDDADLNLDCCTPRAKTPTRGPLEGLYYFKNKQIDAGGTAKKFWFKDGERDLLTGESHYPCNSDASYLDSGLEGCMYDTRVYRDWATNFIGRHADEPFFLTIPLHSLHEPMDAPVRTLAHYSTAGLVTNAPGTADRFWSSLEEVDAAIGKVIETLEGGVCNSKSSPETAGLKCASNGDCGGTPGAACVTDLAQRTLILFTADQGQTNAPYGSAILREGKGSTFDGGLRVGLLAWDPGLGVGSAAPGGHMRGDPFVASQVDILPTVLDAAGCAPNHGDDQYEIKACVGRNVSRPSLCDSDQDCAAVGGGSCVSRLIAGRTMLPALVGAGTPVRDFAFASYPSEPQMISVRSGYYSDGCSGNADCNGAAKICSYVGEQGPDAASGTLDRSRLGGSCDVCESDGDCSGTMCIASGTYCVPSTDSSYLSRCTAEPAGGALDPVGDECDPAAFQRCWSAVDCGRDERCVQVETTCNGCRAAAWKLMGGGGVGVGNPSKSVALFDLGSNPEESESLDCIDEAKNPSNPDYAKLSATDDDLRRRLDGWFDCISAGLSVDCDTQKSPQ